MRRGAHHEAHVRAVGVRPDVGHAQQALFFGLVFVVSLEGGKGSAPEATHATHNTTNTQHANTLNTNLAVVAQRKAAGVVLEQPAPHALVAGARLVDELG